MNTGPLSRSGAAITKAAAAASNIPPATDHMIARFMALPPWTLGLSPRRGSAVKHAAFKAGLRADLLNCDKSGDAARAALSVEPNVIRRSAPAIRARALWHRRPQVRP